MNRFFTTERDEVWVDDCPKCNSSWVATNVHYKPGKAYFECLDCGYKTRHYKDLFLAARAWNKAAKKARGEE